MTDTAPIGLQDFREAAARIGGLVCQTPLKPAYTLSQDIGKPVFYKLETMQATGAFKLRGAANAILSLPNAQRQAGVVTMSSGNHGRAIAYVARALGIRSRIWVSEQVPAVKVAAIASLGGTVEIEGKDQDQATEFARIYAKQHGMTFISPFDDRAVIAGQGTIALEVLAQNPAIDTLVVPVSGGGLMAGIALAARALKPGIRLIGVSQKAGAAMYESIRAGKITPVRETPSLADALQGGIPPDNRYTFPICRKTIDTMILLEEAEIAAAMRYAFFNERLVLEGGGAAPIGCLRSRRCENQLGSHIAAVLTGDNVDPQSLMTVLQKGH